MTQLDDNHRRTVEELTAMLRHLMDSIDAELHTPSYAKKNPALLAAMIGLVAAKVNSGKGAAA